MAIQKMLVGLIFLGGMGRAHASPGSFLPLPPTAPPGRVSEAPADLIQAAIDRQTQGDTSAAIRYYELFVGGKKGDGRLRAAAWIALGHLYENRGDFNLAANAYSRARSAGTPVAPWGAWHLARAEQLRGNHNTAAGICSSYEQKYPKGPHIQDCLVLMGDAYAAAGQRGAAAAAYQKWLDSHPDSPLQETIRLRLTLSASRNDPKGSVAALQELLVSHSYHSTGLGAAQRLAELAAAGIDTSEPTSDAWLCRIALERKRCGFETEAWQRYQEIQARAAQNPELEAWLDQHEDDFLWGTKQYQSLAGTMKAQLATKPDATTAWQLYRAMVKGGMWKDAAQLLLDGAKMYGGRFSGAKVDTARALLLAGRYAEAKDRWVAIGGKEGRWLAAYASFRAGDLPDALARFDAIIQSGADEALAARYYRARTLDGLGRGDEASAERGKILGSDPFSWYSLLIQAEETAPGEPMRSRNGRWPAPTSSPTLPAQVRVGSTTPTAGRISVQATAEVPRVDWSRLAWAPFGSGPTSGGQVLPAVAAPLAVAERPDSYQPSFLSDPGGAWRLLDELGVKEAELFPWAQGAADLGRAGAFDDAAPAVSRMYQAMEADETGAYKNVDLNVAEWRQIFMLVRDNHHVARFSWGTTKMAANEEQRLEALRSMFPTAHIDAIYRHGERWSVDPLLVLGLMRQESVYQQWALSPVGAIGLMQVMPRTGAKVAAMVGDSHYSPESLENPSINIRYGIYYLSRLLDRFGGSFPMAVGSYNGGPHNMSSWLSPWGAEIRMDDYVEQIPYTETRDYIKKVSGYYATYTSLYAPAGARVIVPMKVEKDDASIVNF